MSEVVLHGEPLPMARARQEDRSHATDDSVAQRVAIAAKSCVDHVRFHDGRHTALTRLAEKGQPDWPSRRRWDTSRRRWCGPIVTSAAKRSTKPQPRSSRRSSWSFHDIRAGW